MSYERKRHRNGKLDSFLQRTLTAEAYERICTWESCVVASEVEKLVHKYVVLSSSCVYLLDFNLKSPPKVAFSIKNVADIRKLDGVPEFLDGKDRDEVVHIRILCTKRVAPEKSIDNWLSVDMSPKLLTKLKGKVLAGRSPTPSDVGRQKMGFPHASPSPPRPLPTLTRKSLSPSIDRSPLATHHIVTDNSPLVVTHHTVTDNNIPLVVTHHTVTDNNTPLVVTHHTVTDSTPLQRDRSSELDTMSTHSLGVIEYHKRPKKKVGFEFADTRTRSKSVNAIDTSSLQQEVTGKCDSLTSMCSDLSEDSFVAKSKCSIKSTTFDLYILRKDSDFHYQITASWECWKIVSSIRDTTPVKGNKSREQTSQLYYQLKHEVMASVKMEVLAKLFVELTSACERHLVIKRLFWDSSELLEVCLHQMEASLRSHEQLADVLEYCVIIVDLLYHMMLGSFMCHRRLDILFQNRGQESLRLVELLMASIRKCAGHEGNVEMKCLGVELAEKVFCVLSELLRAAQQLRWCREADSRYLGLSYLVDYINSREIKCEGLLVRYLAGHLSSLLQADGQLSRSKAITLYHMLQVLHNLLLNCPKFVAFFKKELMDEIRYYLRVATLEQSLPDQLPLNGSLLTLLKHIQDSLKLHST